MYAKHREKNRRWKMHAQTKLCQCLVNYQIFSLNSGVIREKKSEKCDSTLQPICILLINHLLNQWQILTTLDNLHPSCWMCFLRKSAKTHKYNLMKHAKRITLNTVQAIGRNENERYAPLWTDRHSVPEQWRSPRHMPPVDLPRLKYRCRHVLPAHRIHWAVHLEEC